jgi:hypothetical protein
MSTVLLLTNTDKVVACICLFFLLYVVAGIIETSRPKL